MDIKKLINPASVAVVGASDRPTAVGYRVARACLASGNGQRVYLVNPTKDQVQGRPCYHTLADLPERVDSVVVCTPRESCADILRQAGELGVKGAVVYASGFSEEGTQIGREMEAELLAICKQYDMAMLGPNCAGFTNNIQKIFHTMPGLVLENRPTGIGILSQSGFIATSLTKPDYMNVSYGFSTGNSNCVHLEDLLEFMVHDPDTNVLAIYLEGVRDGEKFIRQLEEAYRLGKPVVLLKTGRSARGARATASHTGSISGAHQIYESVFRKYNVITVDSLQELIYTAQAMNVLIRAGKLPRGEKVAAINISGAENVLCADMGETAGVKYAELCQATKDGLRELLPGFATPANPLDATTDFFGKIPETIALLRTMGSDPDAAAVSMGVEVDHNPSSKDMCQIEAIAQAAALPDMKPLFAMCSLEATRDPACRKMLEDAGVPVLGPATIGYKMLGEIMAYAVRRLEGEELPPAPQGRLKGERQVLTEHESKELLRQAGVPMPKETIVASEEELCQALADFRYPVVLKINSPDIAHKSDAGGVKLGLNSQEEAVTAWREMMVSCAAYDPKARLEGALLCEMIPQGLEFIVGVNNDPQLGPVVLVGMGGIFVELFGDCAMSPAPVTRPQAQRMVASLKASRLLDGYRGGPVYDREALVDLLVRVSEMAAERSESLHELDINPVMVLPQGQGAMAADALAVVSKLEN